MKKLGLSGIEEIKRLPQSPVDSLFNAITAPAFFHNSRMCSKMAIQSCDKLLREGAVDGSWQALCIFAGLLSEKEYYKEACDLADVALKSSQFSEDMERAAVGLLAPSVALVWSVPVRHLIDLLQINFEFSQQVGASFYSGLSALELGAHAVFSGAHLDEVDQRIWSLLKFMTQQKNLNCYDNLLPSQLAVNVLRLGKPAGAFAQPDATDLALLKELGSFNANNPVSWYALNRLWTDYLMGNYESAWKCYEICQLFPGALPFAFGSVIRDVFSCLLLARKHQDLGLAKWRVRFELQSSLSRLRKLADFCPENFGALYNLVQGEFDFRVRGKKALAAQGFARAVQIAQSYEQNHWRALAEELAGRLAECNGDARSAQAHFSNSYELYLRWGATAKADQLKRTVSFSRAIAEAKKEDELGETGLKQTA